MKPRREPTVTVRSVQEGISEVRRRLDAGTTCRLCPQTAIGMVVIDRPGQGCAIRLVCGDCLNAARAQQPN